MDGEAQHRAMRIGVGDTVVLLMRDGPVGPGSFSVDLWNDPHTRSAWLSVPIQKMHPGDVAVVLDRCDSSCKVLTNSGIIGWLEVWDIQKVEDK